MKKPDFKVIANRIRQDVVKTLANAGTGHTASSLGMTDVFTALYFGVLKHQPRKPKWALRDRVFVSNGHICPLWYTTLAHSGYFAKKDLLQLRRPNSKLQGHPTSDLPGIEIASGKGHGLSIAIGSALASKMDNKTHQTYCMLSDGEHNEGQTWEAIMLAGKYKLNNLTAIVDRNNIQADGYTEDVMPLEPLRTKYEAFNWHVLEVDGHDIYHIIDALNEAKTIQTKPTVIIAHTIPGKGVSFMENKYEWHGKAPTQDQEKIALTELRKT